jgi:hypothetical protein
MDTLPQRVGEQTVSKRSHAPKDPKPAWPCHQDIPALSNTRAHPPILSSGMSSQVELLPCCGGTRCKRQRER